MIYIFESELPENKSVYFALINIYGIGKSNAFLICKKLGFSTNLKIKNLSKEQSNKLVKTIEFLNIELASDLKKLKLLIAKKLVYIKSYRGLRRNQGLPVRGQRTHTNAQTARKRR
jgi:small subunit ribosomal protein S13